MQPGAAAGPIYVYPDGDVLGPEDMMSEWACPAVPAALCAAEEEGGGARSVKGFRFDADAFQACLEVGSPFDSRGTYLTECID